MFEELIADDFRIEQEVTGFDGRTVTSYTTTWGAGMPPQVEPLKANEKYVIEEGKIASITWTPTEESAAKLAAAMVEIEAMEIVSTVNEAWNAGDVDTLKSLYAANGEVCMPDWGPDCTSGAEEIGQWIEELVAVNFVIEPQSLEVEGAIVTEVAKVWADPLRALEIAPLVTTDVDTRRMARLLTRLLRWTRNRRPSLRQRWKPLKSQRRQPLHQSFRWRHPPRRLWARGNGPQANFTCASTMMEQPDLRMRWMKSKAHHFIHFHISSMEREWP